jgi:hypothetical protein
MYAVSKAAPVSPSSFICSCRASGAGCVGSVTIFCIAMVFSFSLALVWSVTICLPKALTASDEPLLEASFPSSTSFMPPCAASM